VRFLGQHKLHPGDVFGRWTVVRHMSPVQRVHGRDKFVHQHRVLVRCICGETRMVREVVILKGRSRGCASRTCGHSHRIRAEVAKVEEVRERARREYEDADLVIRAANSKMENLWGELNRRRSP
jgi:hypothetical protein